MSFLLLTLLTLKDVTVEQIKLRARSHQIHTFVFLTLAMIAATISIIAFRLIRSTPKEVHMLTTHLTISVCAIASTWFLLHTLFAQQYAALYYRSNAAQGLQFSDQADPNYWDFLYFSFVIGATTQTSDTFITTRSIRRLVLGQAIVSSWFFVGIIGMTINIVSGMVGAK